MNPSPADVGGMAGRGPRFALALARGLCLRQSDPAVVPFPVLGGALAVRDEVALRYDIVARWP